MSKDKYILILKILLHNHPKEMYGLEIVKASDGKLPRGTIYVYLYRLENAGEISSRVDDKPREEGELPQRLYRLTDKGTKRLRDEDTEKISLRGLILGT